MGTSMPRISFGRKPLNEAALLYAASS
jgi:hypothetical protein